MNEKEMHWAEQMEQALDLEKQKSSQMQKEYGNVSSYMADQNDNLIKWQLDLESEKEKVYHILQGHQLKDLGDGNHKWIEPTDPKHKPLTSYGVERIMNIIEFYLSRNTLLSNYSIEEINVKMEDIGLEISDGIYLEYEYVFNKPKIKELMKIDLEKIQKLKNKISSKYGIDSEAYKDFKEELIEYYEKNADHIFKKNCRMYPLLIRMLIDLIHSAYLRALDGGERESLRTARHVSQNDSPLHNSLYPNVKSGGSKWYNPANLFK